MRHEFENTTPVTIDPGPPGTVASTIQVSGVDGGAVQDVDVLVDIEHTWTGDLNINLLSPSGQRVVLVDRRGGDRDHFTDTEFDSDAEVSIANASPPYRGTFKPEGDLGELRNRPANGTWTLEVNDRAFQDGGAIREWGLAITTGSPATSAFVIDVRFLGGLTDAQKSAFDVAATRWSELIVGDLPDVVVDGQTVDDVRIDAEGVAIDGPGKILGQAGPTRLRPGSFLPATGVMSFDTADLAQMEADGSLVRVIMHEMAHVLGFGTIWDRKGLLQGAGTVNPTFTGAGAIREFAALRGETAPLAVPVANQGGPGTRDSHWREQVFGNELMTGFLNGGVNPIGRLSVAGLEDLGYQVSYDAADPYTLPSALTLAIMAVGAEAADHGEHGMMLIPHQAVLPEDALVDG